MKKTLGLLVLSGWALYACGAKSERVPFAFVDFYRGLAAQAEDFLFVDGDWKEDFDDGAFYGPAFYAWAGKMENNSAWLARAAAGYADNLSVVEGVIDLLDADVNNLGMSLLGMIEYMAATGKKEDLALLDEMIGRINDLVESMGHYVPPALMGGYSMETYGPTSINGLLALIGLQRAYVLGKTGVEDMVEFSTRVAERIDEEHYNGQYYDFSAERPGLFLYPNITMIIVCARLYQLTGEESFRQRALSLYQAIEPLKVKETDGLAAPGRYRSPYSAEHMGAQSDDYSTLSAQNYLMLSQMLLYKISGDKTYLEQMDPVVAFLRDRLQGQSCYSDIHLSDCQPECGVTQACLKQECFDDDCHQGILHHWMDGRAAVPSDPEFFCSGCNLQLLYLLWYRQEGLWLEFLR